MAEQLCDCDEEQSVEILDGYLSADESFQTLDVQEVFDGILLNEEGHVDDRINHGTDNINIIGGIDTETVGSNNEVTNDNAEVDDQAPK